MSTTIQVQDETLVVLKRLREQFNALTYDALLKELIKKATRSKKSLWGAGGKMRMNELLSGLRDKHDRY